MVFILDIDGVMVSINPKQSVEIEPDGFYKFQQSSVDALNSVLTTDDEILISSSHRFSYTITEWMELFKVRGIKNQNIKRIPAYIVSNFTRMGLIMMWFKSTQPLPGSFVIIDDDKSLNDLPKHLKERLVLTDSFYGLNDNTELKRIIKR